MRAVRRLCDRGEILVDEKILEEKTLEGTMAQAAVHELNNLITVILGSAELAHRDAEGQPRLEAHLERIRRASLRASDLCHRAFTPGEEDDSA